MGQPTYLEEKEYFGANEVTKRKFPKRTPAINFLLTVCLIVILHNAVKVQNGKKIFHYFFSEILHQQASGASEPGINVSTFLFENIMLKQT
jgi:hypothetical protein